MKYFIAIFLCILFSFAGFSETLDQKASFKKELTDYLQKLKIRDQAFKTAKIREETINQFLFTFSTSFLDLLKDNSKGNHPYFQGLTGGFTDLLLTLRFYHDEIYEGEWERLTGGIFAAENSKVAKLLREKLHRRNDRILYLTQWEDFQRHQYLQKIFLETAEMLLAESKKEGQNSVLLLSGYSGAFFSYGILVQFLSGVISLEVAVDSLVAIIFPG